MPDSDFRVIKVHRRIIRDPMAVNAPTTTAASVITTLSNYKLSLRDDFTITNPGTTFTTVFDITGSGFLLGLVVSKPATGVAYSVKVKLTVDGVVVVNDAAALASSTSAEYGLIVGLASTPAGMIGGPLMLEFNKSLKLEVAYSGAAGVNITGNFVLVYA